VKKSLSNEIYGELMHRVLRAKVACEIDS
jgi:hypothetical protein